MAQLFKKRTVSGCSLFSIISTGVRGGKFNHNEFWTAFDAAYADEDPVMRLDHLITAFGNSGELSDDVFKVIQAYFGALSFSKRKENLARWRGILDDFGVPPLTNDMWTIKFADTKAHPHVERILATRVSS